ncbi:hypothetical protein ABEV34_05025 [Methylorubrum rhodesianum]|uniref:hypothetical protein n=1 Tax=Methylorubrum rhodesianum TaxID=29427 RepID=UPI003D28E46B
MLSYFRSRLNGIIDARIAAAHAVRQAEFFDALPEGDPARRYLAEWEPAARTAGWKPKKEMVRL